MSVNIYLRDDIANVLRATANASNGSAGIALELLSDPKVLIALAEVGVTPQALINIYQSGVHNALISVGLGFGLEPVCPQINPGVTPSLAGLLWTETRDS